MSYIRGEDRGLENIHCFKLSKNPRINVNTGSIVPHYGRHFSIAFNAFYICRGAVV
jgi:hypothetical protein